MLLFFLGNAYCHKMFNFFCKNFKSVDDAERHFNIKYFDNFPLVVDGAPATPKSGTGPALSTSVKLSPIFEYSPTTENIIASDTVGQATKSIISL